MAMCGEGVRFIAKGVCVEHFIERLGGDLWSQNKRPASLKTKQKRRSEPGCLGVCWLGTAGFAPPLRITAEPCGADRGRQR